MKQFIHPFAEFVVPNLFSLDIHEHRNDNTVSSCAELSDYHDTAIDLLRPEQASQTVCSRFRSGLF